MATKKRSRRASAPAKVADDDIRAEYDFSQGRPNPYAARLRGDVVVVALDPDVAVEFPDAASVNDALRALAKIATRRASKSRSKRRTA